MSGKPYQSCLTPYETEIITLRRKRPPTPYSQISELLWEKYQIKITRAGVFEYVKRLVINSRKTCKYAWESESSDRE